MSIPESRKTPLTPAAQRLQSRLTEFGMASCVGNDEINELAAAVLNTSEIEASDEIQAMKEVLKGEFPMVRAEEEIWDKAAASMVAKLESLGYAVVPSQQEESP